MSTLKSFTIVSAFVLGLFLNGLSATTSYELAGSLNPDEVSSNSQAYISSKGNVYVFNPDQDTVVHIVQNYESVSIDGAKVIVTSDNNYYIYPISDNSEFAEFVETL